MIPRPFAQWFVAILVAVAVSGCAGLFPKSYEQKVAVADEALTGAIAVAATLSSRNELTADEHTCLHRLFKDAEAALVQARSLGSTAGQAKLDVALKVLAVVEPFLLSRENRQPTSEVC